MKGKLIQHMFVLLSLSFLLLPSLVIAATMEDYCVIPPYVKTDLEPNIFVIMDNYCKMGEPAYCSTHGSISCHTSISCTDTYDPTKTYPGYFQSNIWYSYESGNKFVPDVNGIFKGNLLNWVLTSRYDLLESILVGGVSASRQLRQVNTLKSIGNQWTKTYSGCNFEVNGGSVTVSESVANACELLDPARLSASLQHVPPIIVVKNEVPPDLYKNIADNFVFASEKVSNFIVAPVFAAPAQPLEITTNSLLAATEDAPYSVNVQAVQRPAQEPYSWDITSGSLPTGLSLEASNRLGVVILGTPDADTAGGPVLCASPGYTGQSWPFTIRIRDRNGTPATKDLSIFVKCPMARPPQTFTGRVCAGDYALNCDSSTLDCTSDSDCPSQDCANGTCSLKNGIIEMFWTQARFGLGAFTQAGHSVSTSIPTTPTSAGCIPASPMSSYMSAGVENTAPNIDAALTPLINAEYDAIGYYATDGTVSCNPFNNATACLKNFILIITGGDGADNYNTTPYLYTDATNCGSLTYNLSKNACFGYNNDLRNNPTFGVDNLAGVQNVSTYIVNVLGVNGTILNEAANAGGGKYYPVTDPTQLRAQLIQAFQDMIARAASGTAASVLASGAGEGANLIQAVYYPRRKFINGSGSYDEIIWTGRLANLWYYVDPRFSSSTMLEDTTVDSPYRILNLSSVSSGGDYRIRLYFDATQDATVANRYNFGSTTIVDTKKFEYLNYLWEAGLSLWNRDVSSDPRKIFTTLDGTSMLSNGFSVANASALQTYLQADSPEQAQAIIRYLHGEGDSFTISGTTHSYRPRTVSVDINGDGDVADTFMINGVSFSENPSPAKVWKFGDVVNSTPKIASWIKLNTYDEKYGDTSYKNFLNSSAYTNRGMVFTGANDGMLHAFKFGRMEVRQDPNKHCTLGTNQYACLYNSNTSIPVGKEMWAFIPKNALPYLKYFSDPTYCHVFTVDLLPYVFDASLGKPGSGDFSGNTRPDCTGSYNPNDDSTCTWRTIVIGGMRFGGASKPYNNVNCSTSTPDGVCAPVAVSGTSIGYSSYFALDITDFMANQDDPANHPPQLLWEFSDSSLGFTTAGPTVIRIGNRDKNGKWVVVLASGPTGPIDSTNRQFLGHSDQNLKLFVLDLKTGVPVSGSPKDTNIQHAFAGSMLNATIDPNLDYSDEVVYVPYVREASDGTWTQGGVGRLLTRNSTDLSSWEWSPILDGIGPVTSSVANLQKISGNKLWLYFGTGRYFYEQRATVDDGVTQRRIYGIKEPCYSSAGFSATCPSLGTLDNVTTPPAATDPEPNNGWYLDLDPCMNSSGGTIDCSAASVFYRPERVITDPLATTGQVVYFTTFKPYSDICSLGGKSLIWAVKYNTGGYAGALLKGVALLQVSTGSIEQKDLSTAFNPSDSTGGRRTAAMEGVPPSANGLSILAAPPPAKRVIHLKER